LLLESQIRPRAILRDGVIYPIEPLPAEWSDGRELWLEEAEADSPQVIEQWRQEVEALVARLDPENYQQLEAALTKADRQDKEGVRGPWRKSEPAW
jgi:hypothetical protein